MGNHRIIQVLDHTIIVDEEDYNFVQAQGLSVVCRGHLRHVYINTNPWYKQPLHRVLYLYRHCILENAQVIDHINGNGLDNRRSNLRITNKVGNALNMRRNITKTLDLPKGVFTAKRDGKYRSCIKVNKVSFSLGEFNTVQEAEYAYLAALSDYWNYTGAIGRLRRIQEPSSGGQEQQTT